MWAWFKRSGWMWVGVLPFALWGLRLAYLTYMQTQMPECNATDGFTGDCSFNGKDYQERLMSVWNHVTMGFLLFTGPFTVVWAVVVFTVVLLRKIRYMRLKP